MNTGQMMLTLGAIVLFGIQLLNLNQNEMSTYDEVSFSKYSIMATALAKSTIDNAFGLKFDANTVYGNAYPDVSGKPKSGSFTAPGDLGCSSSELTGGKPDPSKFNDFDDYHNCTTVVDTLPSAIFTVSSTVVYVDAALGFTPASYLTWDKQITVTVTSPSLRTPVRITAVNSYWKY